MSDRLVIKAVIDSVPQWYESDYGPFTYELSLNGQTVNFCSQRPLTPLLSELFEYSKEKLEIWKKQLPAIPTPSSINNIRQEIAITWLKKQDSSIAWNKLIAYMEELCFRTYENDAVTLNLIISEGNGSHDITTKEIQKILDPIGCSLQTYIHVDKKLKFIDYKEILWSDITDSKDYKFNPEFLQPFKSILKQGQYSVHLTKKGDIVIMSHYGLLVTCRKGQWTIYDASTFKNCIVDIVGNYRVGCNLFEIMLDLSYKRHGALLVYDPKHLVIDHIVNRDSVISGKNPTPDLAREILSKAILPIKMENVSHSARKKRLFLEVACLDGAIVFDSSKVFAFGSMIETHPDTGSQLGARSTAARSAYLWGRSSY